MKRSTSVWRSQGLHQQAGFAFPGAGAVLRASEDATRTPWRDRAGQRVEYLGVDRGLAGVAGEVGLVD